MSFEQINKSPLNTSTAKALFSFPKAKRFTELPEEHSQLYSLPTTISKRAAGIGYGKKSNFDGGSISPGPNRYEIKPDLAYQLQKNKGWTISIGRDKSNKYDGIFLGLIQKTPGPGQYKHTDMRSNIKYTIRKRTESVQSKEKRPGPGTYNIPNALNQTGKYKISQFRDSGAIILSPRCETAQRFYTPSKMQTPGPGQYKHGGDIDPRGMYFCSKFTDTRGSSFNRAKRELIANQSANASPGPGNYKLPSDFGHYD